MENNTRYRHFTFTPKLLQDTRKQVERRYDELDQLTASQLSAYRLPKLLELIRQTPLDQIHQLNETLKKTDIMVLLYEYPYPNESHDTRRKINLVLCGRYSVTIGVYAWNLFQHDLEDVYLQDLLRRIYAIDHFSFLSTEWEDSIRQGLEQALADRTGISSGLIPLFLDGRLKATQLLQVLKIKPGAPLEEELIYQMLLQGLGADSIVHRDGPEFIRTKLERYPVKEYQVLLEKYLEARTHGHFDPPILNQAIERLQDPRERIADWEFLQPHVLDEVRRWLLENELKKFFEQDTNRRFDYWKQYLPYIENVIQLKDKNDPKVAFIYFNKFVVVEFGNIGAAYFYHREGFDQHILSRTKRYEFRSKSVSAKEALLKETAKHIGGTPLYIHKLGHHGYYSSWTHKFTMHMREYFDGFFDYKGV